LRLVLEKLQRNQLFSNKSKCLFGEKKIEYLGHIIFAEGVVIDYKKIKGVKERYTPNLVKELRGFLGLIGYYREFIKRFGIISKPLIE